MTERVILIAEDDEEAIASWNRDITEFNRDATRTFHYVPEFARSKRAAIKALDRIRINCAAIDLRLPEDDNAEGHQAEPVGNNVLERLLVEVGVPAVVYSAYPQEASKRVRDSEIMIIGKKGGGQMEALRWLAGHEKLMSAMETTRKRIAEETAKLFSGSIWPRWEKTWKNMEDGNALAGVIARQTASHVAERLGMPPTSYHHPEEFYVVPPLAADRLGTGDLVKLGDRVHIVVSPRCNMSREEYPPHVLLAFCKPMEEIWTGMRKRFNGDEKAQNKAAEELQSYATQGHSISTHFLPPCGEVGGPWLVQFKEILTVPSDQVPALLETRRASVAAQFIPNLVQRYAAYLGRIGQPDLDCDFLRGQVCK